MLVRIKQKLNSRVLIAIASMVLLACTLAMSVFAADLTKVGVEGLTVTTDGATAWTDSASGASWEGTATSGGCSVSNTATSGTLTFKNESGSAKVLSFDYELTLNGGSFSIGEDSKTSDGSFSAMLNNGDSVTLRAKSSETATNKTTVTLTNIKLEVQTVTLVFAAPSNGGYTKDGSAVTANTMVENPSTTTYSLAATPAENYYFAGWYLGDTKVYDSAIVTNAAFATSGTVTAKFELDPLFNMATATGDYTKESLVSINTWFAHDSTNEKTLDVDCESGGGHNKAPYTYSSHYTLTAANKTKGHCDMQQIPSAVWSDSMQISGSATAGSDYMSNGAEEAYCQARIVSDVIRIYAKENCLISLNFDGTVTTNKASGYQSEGSSTSNTLYYLISSSASATAQQVKGGTAKTSGSTGEIAVPKDQYLYVVLEGYARQHYQNIIGGIFSDTSSYSMTFDYIGSITGMTVKANEVKWNLNAGYQDNTGKALGSGTIIVNNESKTVGTDGSIAAIEMGDQSAVKLSIGTLPEGYVHVGWKVTKNGTTTNYYTTTYSDTLTADITAKAILVPKMVITMGANGYADATYTLWNGAEHNGQWVARSTDATNPTFYTSLAAAFAATNKVVLLASATVNGDWTIPSGKTLVIPYKLGDIGNTTPDIGGGGISNYCVVTMNGNLTIDGALMVSAQQGSQVGNPVGAVGHLVLQNGVQITVNGTLYAHGPVTGNGSITANSSATVYEYVQVTDSRATGGDSPLLLSNIFKDRGSKKTFFFSAFVPNNIEVPVTYHSGAALNGHFTISVGSNTQTVIPFIGKTGALFSCSEGAMLKYYDHATGQVVFRVEEGAKAATESVALSVDVVLIGDSHTLEATFDEFYLALASYYRIEVAGDMTINQTLKLLPGAVVDVEETGTLTLSSTGNLIFYRGNDYDNRAVIRGSTTAEEAQGYMTSGYPVNTVEFPGVTYPYDHTVENVGSAKLNVDGELIVNGGLYVTNNLQTYSGFTAQTNGYNYLTGSGCIDMTNSNTNISTIYELMRSDKGTDTNWVEVAVENMKGLKADATADEVVQYNTITGMMCGFTNANNLNAWGELIKLDGFSLDVEGEILLNLKFIIPDWFLENENAYVRVTEENCGIDVGEDRDWSADKTTFDSIPADDPATDANERVLTTWTYKDIEEFGRIEVDKEGRYVFSQGIAAGEMSGKVTVSFYDGTSADPLNVYIVRDGVTETSIVRTVADFAKLAFDETTEIKAKTELAQMCRAMLTYGLYAQDFYKIETLSSRDASYALLKNDAALTESEYVDITGVDTTVVTGAFAETGSIDGCKVSGIRLDLDSTIDMRVYFDDTNTDLTYTVNGIEVELTDGYVEIVNVPPAYWNNTYTITVSDGTNTYTVTCSVYDWIRGCLNQGAGAEQNMAKAMYYYCTYAEAYFAAKNAETA